MSAGDPVVFVDPVTEIEVAAPEDADVVAIFDPPADAVEVMLSEAEPGPPGPPGPQGAIGPPGEVTGNLDGGNF